MSIWLGSTQCIYYKQSINTWLFCLISNAHWRAEQTGIVCHFNKLSLKFEYTFPSNLLNTSTTSYLMLTQVYEWWHVCIHPGRGKYKLTTSVIRSEDCMNIWVYQVSPTHLRSGWDHCRPGWIVVSLADITFDWDGITYYRSGWYHWDKVYLISLLIRLKSLQVRFVSLCFNHADIIAGQADIASCQAHL